MAAAFLHFTQQTQRNRKVHKRQKAAKMQVIIWKVWKQPSMPDWLPHCADFHWLYCCLLNHKDHWRPPSNTAILLPVPGVYLWSTVPLCLIAREPHPIQPFSALSLESTCGQLYHSVSLLETPTQYSHSPPCPLESPCGQLCRSLSHCPLHCSKPAGRAACGALLTWRDVTFWRTGPRTPWYWQCCHWCFLKTSKPIRCFRQQKL